MKDDINISVGEIDNSEDKCYIFFVPITVPEAARDWWFEEFPKQWDDEMNAKLLIAPARLEGEYEFVESSTDKIKELLEEVENNDEE